MNIYYLNSTAAENYRSTDTATATSDYLLLQTLCVMYFTYWKTSLFSYLTEYIILLADDDRGFERCLWSKLRISKLGGNVQKPILTAEINPKWWIQDGGIS